MLHSCEKDTHEGLRTRLSHVELDGKRFNSPGAAGSGIYQWTVLSLQAQRKQKKEFS